MASTYFAFWTRPNPDLIRISALALSLIVFQGDVLYTMSALPARYCSRSWIFIFANLSLSPALPDHDMEGGSFGNTVTLSFKFIFSSLGDDDGHNVINVKRRPGSPTFAKLA